MTRGRVLLEAHGAVAAFRPDDGFRLTRLQLGGRELIVGDPGERGELWWGSFVMAPWTSDLPDGRFRFRGEDYAIRRDGSPVVSHGIARSRRWDWDGEQGTCGLLPEWPFGGTVTIRPSLGRDRLDISMTVTAGDAGMPVNLGWHPWFPRRLDAVEGRVQLPPDALLQHRDVEGRPTGRWVAPDRAHFNDGIMARGPVSVDWAGVGRLRIHSDGGQWIVFDTSDHGICVEPMTGPAGELPRVLAPHESLSLRFSLEWSAGLS